jgi:hypothetical protein
MDVTASGKPDRRLFDRAALRFIILIGFVGLLGDMTYEGARSAIGPFLATLGASATVVGVTAGFGELVGYDDENDGDVPAPRKCRSFCNSWHYQCCWWSQADGTADE